MWVKRCDFEVIKRNDEFLQDECRKYRALIKEHEKIVEECNRLRKELNARTRFMNKMYNILEKIEKEYDAARTYFREDMKLFNDI